MINREKVEFILNKYPEALYNRGEFMWCLLKTNKTKTPS